MSGAKANFFRLRGDAPKASLSLVSCIHVAQFSNGPVYVDLRHHPTCISQKNNDGGKYQVRNMRRRGRFAAELIVGYLDEMQRAWIC